MTTENLGAPRYERVRHELKRRDLVVVAKERISPAMIRMTFGGDDLADITSLAPDDHLKVFVPDANGEMAMRDYTPRSYDNDSKRLVIDFAVHDAGPATAWALKAEEGDHLQIGGPRGSAVLTGEIKRFVLIGDETALPAIGRRIEETGAGVAIDAIVAVQGEEDEQMFETEATLSTRWIHRPEAAAADAGPFLDVLGEYALDEGTYVWVAAEAYVAKAIRTYLLEDRGHPAQWVKASGYWIKGQAGSSDKSIGEEKKEGGKG